MKQEFETGEPHSGAEILDALRNLQTTSVQYLEAMPADIFVQPQGEKWSPADHIRHLAKSTFPMARALGLPKPLLWILFGANSGPSRTFPVLRDVYQARLRAGGKAGKYAPSPKPIPERAEEWKRDVLSNWQVAAEALHAQVPQWKEPALDRYRLPHPLLGKLTVREMLFFALYHNAHHLRLVAGRVEGDRRER